ncbi:hypothetical protein L210DRAFT_852276 [Boletus edulis BED1]|uniref:C2H2-type domain-containing protein n=1 Tax=Boletus edulis BED1 TaxID=1328754 RepID=A0AAD4BMC2_BOLED|nr:hypothetical protein L210DRAFT_852276 [Boletus edulis BED1]
MWPAGQGLELIVKSTYSCVARHLTPHLGQRQSHTSERPFACSIPGCVKRFYNRSDCEHHEESRRHTYFEMDS